MECQLGPTTPYNTIDSLYCSAQSSASAPCRRRRSSQRLKKSPLQKATVHTTESSRRKRSGNAMTAKYPQYIREGFRPMLPAHEQFLDCHALATPMVVEDKSLGTICCAIVPGFEPVVAMQQARDHAGGKSSIWSFPKGHPDVGESDVDAAARETLEEMGIDVKRYVKRKLQVRQAYTYAGFMHGDAWKRHKDFPNESKRPVCVFHKEVIYFLAVLPQALALVPQEEEVVQAAWIPLSKVKDVTYPDMWPLLHPLLTSPQVNAMLQPAVSRKAVLSKKASAVAGASSRSIQKTVPKRAVKQKSAKRE